MKKVLRAISMNAGSVLLWRLVAGGFLFYSSFAKLSEPLDFALSIKSYQMLPAWAIEPFAWVMPRAEIVFGGLLILGLATRLSAVVGGVMYAMFVVAMSQALLRGLTIYDCGCGIVAGEPPSWRKVCEDLVMMGMCALAYFSPNDRLSVDRLLTRKPDADE